jgi:hypothetical protein
MTAVLATDTLAARRPPDVRPGAEGRRRKRSALVGLSLLVRLGYRGLAAPAARRGRWLGLGDDIVRDRLRPRPRVAYSMAEFVGEDDTVDEKTTTLLHAVKGMALLHLADAGWEFIAVRHDARTWSAFRGLLSFSTWLAEHTDMASVTAAVRSGREAAA